MHVYTDIIYILFPGPKSAEYLDMLPIKGP